jgi:hypothetical protein
MLPLAVLFPVLLSALEQVIITESNGFLIQEDFVVETANRAAVNRPMDAVVYGRFQLT